MRAVYLRFAAFAAGAVVAAFLGTSGVYAQPATWAGPGQEWNTPGNWSPAIVPTTTATFAGATPATVQTAAVLTSIGTIQFNAGAPAYTFEIPIAQTLDITGTGIVNNSANAPTFTGLGGFGGTINFQNASTAANANFIVNQTLLQFQNTSNAGTATITNSNFGITNFLAGSSAASATIVNNSNGTTNFGTFLGADTATAANAHITNNSGGSLNFAAATTAGNAVIVNNTGGFVQFGDSGILGDTATAGSSTITGSGTVSFNSQTTAGNATITTNSGGNVFFFDSSTGGSARFITNTGATFDMSGLTAASMTAGSIEGAGSYVLGNKQLVVGSNGLSTEVQGVISGIGGSLDKVGTGTLTLSGINTYTGDTLIDGGILSVNGSISASNVFVNAGGTLGGNGTVGATTVNAGGIVAPGNSIGTLTVAGDIAFHPGSIYQVQVNPAGQTDLIVATTAHLTGGTVQVLPAAGTYGASTQYVIVQTTGGVTGTFADATSSSAFLTPSLSYPTDEVVLTLTRNATSFATVAQTPNQSSVAAALDLSPFSSALVQAILPLSTLQALQAFDALSGEIHASLQTAIIDDSLWVRETLLNRMLQASYGGDGGAMAALGYGGPMVAFADAGGASSALAYADRNRPGFPIKAPPAPVRPDLVFWAQGTGAWGRFDGNSNAAEVSRTFAGFLTGVDRRFGENWRAGIAAGYSNSSLSVNARASSANIDTAHLAAYAAAGFGAFKLRTGAAFSWNTIATDRTIAFPGFSDRAHANYGAGEGQVFGEIGYGMAFGHIAVEPFAGLAFVHLGTESFTESGGAAALAGAGNHEDVGYTTLGARIATRTFLPNGMLLTPHATLAYQHAIGNVTPAAVLAFESTGVGTEITGVPLGRDSALLQVGADLQLTRQTTFGLFYSGELANGVQDHSVNGRFVWRF